MTCHPAYTTKSCGHTNWCACFKFTHPREQESNSLTITERDLRNAWIRMDRVQAPRTAHELWKQLTYEKDDAVQPVGHSPEDGEAISIHRAHLPVREGGMGGESPLRRLDRPEVGIGQGERVIVRDHYGFGPGTARGPVTLDNEGLWYVTFDTDYADTFDYHLLERVYEL